jgi:hypothetical protein
MEGCWALSVQEKDRMKKNKTKDEEQKRKPSRLSLSRETIRSLNDPALLEQARGGVTELGSEMPRGCPGTQTYLC